MKLLKVNKNKNAGFTLLELLLVIGIAAIIGAGIYMVYNKVSVGQQAESESRTLDTLRAGVKSIYAASPDYGTVTKAVLIAGRVVPDNMVSGTNLVNSFGGSVTVLPKNLGAGTNNGFEITYPSVPGAVCAKLVTTAGAQFDAVTVGTTAVKTFGTNAPIDVAATTTACNAASVTILFDSL